MVEYTLSKPILAKEQKITTLNMDFEALSLSDIKNARKVRAFLCDDTKDVSAGDLSPRCDSNLRIGLAWIAAIKNDSRLTLNDVLQLSARDALHLSEKALDYLF